MFKNAIIVLKVPRIKNSDSSELLFTRSESVVLRQSYSIRSLEDRAEKSEALRTEQPTLPHVILRC